MTINWFFIVRCF